MQKEELFKTTQMDFSRNNHTAFKETHHGDFLNYCLYDRFSRNACESFQTVQKFIKIAVICLYDGKNY